MFLKFYKTTLLVTEVCQTKSIIHNPYRKDNWKQQSLWTMCTIQTIGL